jgi:hypothetical protein
MVKKAQPSLIETKSGIRYIKYGRKRYRVVSDVSTSIILENINKILKTVLQQQVKRKRKKSTRSRKTITGPSQPELKAHSEAVLRDERFKNFNLERELLKNQERKSIEAPPPKHDITKLLPDIPKILTPEAGKYLLISSDNTQYTITEKQAQDLVKQQQDLVQANKQIEQSKVEIGQLLIESQKAGADKQQIQQELDEKNQELNKLKENFDNESIVYQQQLQIAKTKLDKSRREIQAAKFDLDRTKRNITLQQQKSQDIEIINMFSGTSLRTLYTDLVPPTVKIKKLDDFTNYLNNSSAKEVARVKNKLLESNIVQAKDAHIKDIEELRKQLDNNPPTEQQILSSYKKHLLQSNDNTDKRHRIAKTNMMQELGIDEKRYEELRPKLHDIYKQTDVPETQKANGTTTTGRGLTNIEIDKHLLNKLPGYVGTYSIDQLKNIPKSNNFNFIMNTQPFPRDGHWVAVKITPNNLEYYDSFADEPSKMFYTNIKKVIPQGVYQNKINRVIHQQPTTDSCGYHAMNFLIKRHNGGSWKETTGYSKIDKSNQYENEIDKFKRFGYIKN